VRGELAASLGNELGAVVKATGRSIEQLKFAKTAESADALSARFTARTAQDKKIEIVLTKIGENLTKVEIRVGVFGDEDVAMTTSGKIKRSRAAERSVGVLQFERGGRATSGNVAPASPSAPAGRARRD